MTGLAAYDPGPAARFREAREDSGLIERIAARMAEGETPERICEAERWPYSMFAQWIISDTSRAEAFARASRFWVDALARRTVGIAAQAAVDPTKVGLAAAKLVIDTNLRVASKLDRGQWGDAASVNLHLRDERVLPDAQTMVLETARTFALILASGAQIADERAKQLPATIEHESRVLVAPESVDEI